MRGHQQIHKRENVVIAQIQACEQQVFDQVCSAVLINAAGIRS